MYNIYVVKETNLTVDINPPCSGSRFIQTRTKIKKSLKKVLIVKNWEEYLKTSAD